MFQSLRAKVAAVLLFPTLGVILLYGAFAYYEGRKALEQELGLRLVAVAQAAAVEMSNGFAAEQLTRLDATKTRVRTRIREKLVALCDATGVRRAFVIDPEYRSLVDTDATVRFGDRLYTVDADRYELKQAFRTAQPAASVLFKGADGLRYKSGYAPVFLEGKVIAVIGVEASAEYFSQLVDFASVLTFVGAIFLFVILVIATLFARQLTQPIGQLVEASQRLARGDWEAIEFIERRDGDEIAALATSFVEMRNSLVDRDRQMQMMLSGIAHEIRNPLGGMRLFCGLLEEDLSALHEVDRVDESSLDHVSRIRVELGYLERVVNDFLDFARQVPLVTECFDAKVFVEQEVGMVVMGDLAAAGCELRIETDPGLSLTGDRAKLRRVLINLIRNAFQASGQGGLVDIRIGLDGHDFRTINVSDNGPGIPEDRLDEITKPFFTTKEKGSGLGLALTQRIIEEHGGTMRVESVIGEGTCICIRLPFEPDMKPLPAEIPEGWLG
jgi:signal transduction histidine kinase